ncbi:MAG: electron transfer flavoprotein subunit beta/FixA family protein [Lentisphaerae bacterium]|jgi:electron transfer flavoprotein beta subunit|nr:electron transfer flavoprotein subunit beta/FixA family protein [Lentisphaerota bacterium]MBT5606730.1 electron transfer flavoprotein subunit beta/FixA family protein [Lentisphaerota bacterium]MBT7056967.1 electron transfer flavoprotein subunit beta/FixA family protein [Lentisphaerota bacterium]MBT7842102.1 electron transfer flavoprotein subunit beta/FixA family protein [Lentisphaerota bacterium]
MRIVVCVKQVPAINEVSIDPETKRLKREGVESVMNPFDLYALEVALRMREQVGGSVIALSMGPKQAMRTVREAIAVGADSGVLLSDRAVAGSDTWATSYAIASTVRHLGNVDLVICGKQAVDGDTAQVGPGIAAHLRWPQVTYVSHVSAVSNTALTLARMHEEGSTVLEVTLPAVLTVVKGINQPRVPTLVSVLASRGADVPVLSAADIGADPERLGLNGSPTRVVKTGPPPPRAADTVILDGPARDAARRIVHELRMQSLV